MCGGGLMYLERVGEEGGKQTGKTQEKKKRANCSVLQCVAVCFSVLQCVAVCCSMWVGYVISRVNKSFHTWN